MHTSPECDKVIPAWRAALVDCGNVRATQTADTGKYKYKYAKLEDVLSTAEQACEKHGLSLSQSLRSEGGVTFCDTMLIHETGQWIIFPGMGMQTDRDPQAVGSATTYMRRYTLTALFAMAVEDDDGTAARNAAKAPPRADTQPTAVSKDNEALPTGSPEVKRRAKEIMDSVPGPEKAAFVGLLKDHGITTPLNPGVQIGEMEKLFNEFANQPEEEAF